MNGDLVPAVVAASGGSVLLGSILGVEARRVAEMRAGRVRLRVRFGRDLEVARAVAALDALAGGSRSAEIVAELVASDGSIEHFLWLPKAVRGSAVASLSGVLGSVRATEEPATTSGIAMVALGIFVPTPFVGMTDGGVEASRALLSGLAGLSSSEQVIVRWALAPGDGRRWQPPADGSRQQRVVERLWQQKRGRGRFAASGLVLIRARTVGRAQELARHVESIIRSRQALIGTFRITSSRSGRSLSAFPKVTRSSGTLSSTELVGGLLGWPLGSEQIPGVEAGASRELLAPRQLPRVGRQLFVGRDQAGERPVALDVTAARHHMAVVGPSGVGKSVLLTRAILSDIESGYGGVVIDPKADLLASILQRVSPAWVNRLVVLDPGDAARPLPGLAVLSGGDPDLRTDVLAGTLKAIFGTAWGVRSDFYGRLAIRTLAEVPGASLADLGRLFFEDGFRRSAVARLNDPVLLASWQGYEALSPGARAEHVQAPMARVMALLSRPRVRAILASPDAKLDVPSLLAERKWLLVSLAPGQLSEAGARIVGASLVYLVWSAIEARVTLQPAKRHPLFIYVDELSTLTDGLPFGFELLAERARGLGAGLSVALQTLGRIPEPTRSALLGNVATFITFRAAFEEAGRLARQLPGLTESDVASLGRYEVAARVGVGAGSAITVVTGRTEALPPETGIAEQVRDASAARYGTPPDTEMVIEPDISSSEARLGRGGRSA